MEQYNTAEQLFFKLHQCTIMLHRGKHGDPRGGHGHAHAHGKGGDARHPVFDGMAGRGQGRLLTVLLSGDGIAQKEIVEALDIRPSSAGELIAKLEQHGLVERRQDEEDKRVWRVYLTEEGRNKAKQQISKRAQMAQDMFGVLSQEEQEQLCALLEKLVASLKERYGDFDEHASHGRRGQGPEGCDAGHSGFGGHRGPGGPEGFDPRRPGGFGPSGRPGDPFGRGEPEDGDKG